MDNGIHNLIFAHGRCNGDKSVNIAAKEHAERWLARLGDDAPVLGQIADAKRWPSDRDATLAAARAIYLRLPSGFKLWRDGNEFESADPRALMQAFTAAG